MTNFTKKLFEKAKYKVSIDSPKEFKKDIKRLKKKGFTSQEKKSLLIAQNRARAILKRENLSKKEKGEFKKIARMKLPKITKRN